MVATMNATATPSAIKVETPAAKAADKTDAANATATPSADNTLTAEKSATDSTDLGSNIGDLINKSTGSGSAIDLPGLTQTIQESIQQTMTQSNAAQSFKDSMQAAFQQALQTISDVIKGIGDIAKVDPNSDGSGSSDSQSS